MVTEGADAPGSADCVAFAYRGEPVFAGEVLRAAHFRGDLRRHWQEWALAEACEEQALRQQLDPDEAALESMAERFRYENDLITAEEAEAWLEKRGLSAEDFQNYFVRQHWRAVLGDKGALDRPAELPSVAGRLGRLQAHVFMSGAFGALAKELSWRLTTLGDPREKAGPAGIEGERRRFFERSGLEAAGVAAWLSSVERSAEWLEGMLGMEATYRLRCEEVLTPEILGRALSAARLSLTRIDLETMEFDSADSAREAQLCVRDDGLSMEEVARESHFPYRRTEVLAEDLPENQRQRLLCSGIGEVLGPWVVGGVFQIARALRRVEPALSDTAVRSRVERRLLDSHFSEVGAMDLRWHLA